LQNKGHYFAFTLRRSEDKHIFLCLSRVPAGARAIYDKVVSSVFNDIFKLNLFKRDSVVKNKTLLIIRAGGAGIGFNSETRGGPIIPAPPPPPGEGGGRGRRSSFRWSSNEGEKTEMVECCEEYHISVCLSHYSNIF
jgi:hypothetical protein